MIEPKEPDVCDTCGTDESMGAFIYNGLCNECADRLDEALDSDLEVDNMEEWMRIYRPQ